MLEKLGGLAVIVITITVLCLISLLNPPTFIQILCGLVGSFICLVGNVFLFAEGQLLTKNHWIKRALKVGRNAKAPVS